MFGGDRKSAVDDPKFHLLKFCDPSLLEGDRKIFEGDRKSCEYDRR
ncbi:hypothetical protein JMA_24580 [Jeotgalibacillus malaysiensis]|uniref:Uncharacterized protein n=1 Tax=Jeotgalibacillus malaysiensis TaxID=1508404 RepID=A0A0B5ANE0_9BACL|nr:hypothetical protein JMA_24580 [Jeotgalibacillus malaysiensis]